jgi:ribosome biogenesis GTPase A
MSKFEYKKDYRINEKSIFEKEEGRKEESNLTTFSPLPGTTIGITKVEYMKFGIKLFDTPGILNKS